MRHEIRRQFVVMKRVRTVISRLDAGQIGRLIFETGAARSRRE